MVDILSFFIEEETPLEVKEVENIYDTSFIRLELDQELMKQDHAKAIEKGYLPYSFNECYGKQITSNAYIYIQRLQEGDSWTSYRLTYNYIDGNIKSEKTIIEGQDFIQVLDKTEKYIKQYLEFISRAS